MAQALSSVCKRRLDAPCCSGRGIIGSISMPSRPQSRPMPLVPPSPDLSESAGTAPSLAPLLLIHFDPWPSLSRHFAQACCFEYEEYLVVSLLGRSLGRHSGAAEGGMG
jgi:hypothetical protein